MCEQSSLGEDRGNFSLHAAYPRPTSERIDIGPGGVGESGGGVGEVKRGINMLVSERGGSGWDPPIYV